MAQAPPVAPIAAALADRYTLECELGRGGMATVYLAEEKTRGRKVAIKVLRPEITAALGTERFLREIGIAARLSHPHIVPLIDSGEAGGFLYYVQPHIPGGSLRDRLDETRQLPLKEALRIAQEIGAGLDFAHRKGFVHRDVKPENILFADGHAVLADFGVARACDSGENRGGEMVTEVGFAVGTPAYMSPEQASGQAELGAASDVYSLACVVYEMLAGEPPFQGSDARAVMAKQVTESPRPLRGFRPEVPVATERAVVHALEKDRQQRYVFEIQDEIAATIVNTLRATMFADVSEYVARRYTENIQAYGLYLKGRYAWNKRTQEGVAEAISYFEQAIAEDPGYAPAYAGLADSYALDVDYRSIPVDEAYRRAKQYAHKALQLDEPVPSAHASLAWSLFVYDWDWDGADREFRRAIELNPRYASAHQWYAFLLASRGEHDAALLEGHTALELDPASVSARRGVGWLAFYARRFDQALDHLARAIEMNPMAVESYRILGTTLAMRGQLADAERRLRDALALPGAGAYTTATLGWVLGRAGKLGEAEQLLRELEATGRDSYVSPVAFAILHIGLGNLDRALDWAN